VDEVLHEIPYTFVDTHSDLMAKKGRVDMYFHGDDEIVLPGQPNMYQETKDRGMFRYIRRTEGISTRLLISRLLLREQCQSPREIEKRQWNYFTPATSFNVTSRRIANFARNDSKK